MLPLERKLRLAIMRDMERLDCGAEIAHEAIRWLKGGGVQRDFKVTLRRSIRNAAWTAALEYGVLGYSAAGLLIRIDVTSGERV